MKIGAIVNYNNGKRNGRSQTTLVDNLRTENFDILCCHDTSYERELMFNESSFLADKLGMTYSFTVTNLQADNGQREKIKKYPLAGLTIMAGSSAWMLSSGSFPLLTGDKNSLSAQFAIIRKDGNAVLVVNILFEGERGHLRRTQLRRLLDHPVLNKPYAAVLLCGNFTIKDKKKVTGKNKFSYTVRNGFAAGGGCGLHKRKYKGLTAGISRSAIPNIFVLEDGVDQQTIFNYTDSRLFDSFTGYGKCLGHSHAGVVFNMDISRETRNTEQQMYRYVSCTNPWQKTPKRALGCCG